MLQSSVVWSVPFRDNTCSSTSDCGLRECCVVGFTRFSTPSCRPRGQLGDWCITGAKPENRTLAYPNGEVLKLSESYTHFCPCDDGLNCVRNVCQPLEDQSLNSV